MKCTPGPWIVKADAKHLITDTVPTKHFPKGTILATAHNMPPYADRELSSGIATANARLIAAAPDLIEEIRNLRAWLEYWKSRTISQQSKDERGHVTNSWAACPIPDWDVKQKLESLEALIVKAETV